MDKDLKDLLNETARQIESLGRDMQTYDCSITELRHIENALSSHKKAVMAIRNTVTIRTYGS